MTPNTHGKHYLGGAPLNLAAHLAKQNITVFLISNVGKDQYGHDALEKIKKLQIKTDFIQIDNSHQTGLVNVEVDNNGLPSYDIVANTAYDNIVLDKNFLKNISQIQFDCFCFGTLSQRQPRSRNTLFSLLETINTKHVFCDLNLRQNYFSKKIITDSLKRSSLLKLNNNEAEYLNTILYREKYSSKALAKKLINDFLLEVVIITRGENGCLAYNNNSEIELPGIKTKVIDTIGAGDAFSAGFLSDYLLNNDIKKACTIANELGAKISSQTGAI
ncbi:MAG: carbohydrate kinase [Patescibacteria group bacterium]|nr:carbohydrate kinase [Patescibacteria group bacterium]